MHVSRRTCAGFWFLCPASRRRLGAPLPHLLADSVHAPCTRYVPVRNVRWYYPTPSGVRMGTGGGDLAAATHSVHVRCGRTVLPFVCGAYESRPPTTPRPVGLAVWLLPYTAPYSASTTRVVRCGAVHILARNAYSLCVHARTRSRRSDRVPRSFVVLRVPH